MWIDFVFVFLGFLADNVLRMAFPIDTSLRVLVFVPNLGFLSFLLVSLKKPLPIALGTALLLGLSLDLIHHQMLANIIAYPISIYVVKLWSDQLNESLFEHVFVLIIGLFIKELTQYVVLYIFGTTQLYMAPWFIKREFLTLIGHIPLLFFLGVFNRLKIRINKSLSEKKKRRETVLWNPTLKP